MIRLRTSARSCCGGSGSSSTCKRTRRARTSSRVSPASSCADRSAMRVDVTRELGKRGRRIRPRSVRLSAGNVLSISPFAQRASWSASAGSNPSRYTVTRFGRTVVYDETRSKVSGGSTARKRGRGLGDERFGGMDDLRCHRGDHDPAHGGVTRRVELAEEPVLGRDVDARCLHPRRVRERVGVAQQRAGLGVA